MNRVNLTLNSIILLLLCLSGFLGLSSTTHISIESFDLCYLDLDNTLNINSNIVFGNNGKKSLVELSYDLRGYIQPQKKSLNGNKRHKFSSESYLNQLKGLIISVDQILLNYISNRSPPIYLS